jgi:hypothetical protein
MAGPDYPQPSGIADSGDKFGGAHVGHSPLNDRVFDIKQTADGRSEQSHHPLAPGQPPAIPCHLPDIDSGNGEQENPYQT